MNYYEIEPEQNTFYTLHAEITHRCNMHCNNCYLPNREIADLDPDQLIEFVRRLPSRTDIRLIGAEPTLYKDLPGLIRRIKESGHRITLITNGIKLSNKLYARQLYNSGLRRLSISLNGADQEDIYKQLETGPAGFVEKKVQALRNSLELGLVVSPQMIVVKGVNDHLIKPLLDLMVREGEKAHRPFSELAYPIICRFKTVGQIGRFMKGKSLPLSDLVEVVVDQLNLKYDEVMRQDIVNDFKEPGIRLFTYSTSNGPIYIKVTSWSVDEEGVPDPGSQRRGRITENWKIAPCFEHIKMNEFGF